MTENRHAAEFFLSGRSDDVEVSRMTGAFDEVLSHLIAGARCTTKAAAGLTLARKMLQLKESWSTEFQKSRRGKLSAANRREVVTPIRTANSFSLRRLMHTNRYWISHTPSGRSLGLIERPSPQAALEAYRQEASLTDTRNLSATAVEDLPAAALMVLFDHSGQHYALQAQKQSRRYGSMEELSEAISAFFSDPTLPLLPSSFAGDGQTVRWGQNDHWNVRQFHAAIVAGSLRALLQQLIECEQARMPSRVPTQLIDRLTPCWEGDTVPIRVPAHLLSKHTAEVASAL